MKLTPAMKIILAVAAICIAITLITTNNIATVMVLFGLNSTPAVVTQGTANNAQGTVNNGGAQGGYTDNSGYQSVTPDNSGSQSVTPGGTTSTTPGGSTGSTGSNNSSDSGAAGTPGSGAVAGTPNAGANAGTGNAGGSGNSAPQAGKMTTQQIIDIYKTGINNAHTKAKSAVRVKDGALNYKGVVEAGNLSSVASSLMGMFMVADEASVEVKNEEWKKEEVPAKAGCNLTTSGVKSATCEEKDGKYIVTIVAVDQVNPKAGSDGVGSIVDVIEESQITGSISSVPGLTLSNISIAYENVTVVATIDKATGNMENLKVNAPCYLSLNAKVPLLGSIDNAKVGIQVISEFAMTY